MTFLAVLMAASAMTTTAALSAGGPMVAVGAALLAFGGSVVGWQGACLAEVAHQAPADTAGVATGSVLVFTFVGNVVGPLLLE